MDKKTETLNLLNASIDPGTWTIREETTSNITQSGTTWDYWQEYYYPYVIKESYPIWIQERAVDKGAKAFEIIKILRDKKLVEVRTVKQFVDLMDTLIKIL